MIKKLIQNNSRFFKYCVGGGTAAVVDFGFLYLFTDLFGFWYLWSAIFSFIIAAGVNYSIQKFWTFKCQDKNIGRQFMTFIGVQVVGLFINIVTIYALVEHFSIWYISAKVVAAGIVLIWNFWASKMFVFNGEKKDQIIIAGEIFPPDIGGPATYSHRISKYLIERGYDIKIICYSTVLPARADEEFGSRIIRISSFISLPIKYLIYFLKLFNIALHCKIIYAQGPVASGLPAMLVSKILRKKLVIKIVGDYAWEQARIFNATKKEIDNWEERVEYNAKSWRTNLKLKFIAWTEKTTVKNANTVIVPSHYLKKIVIGWGVLPDKIKVVYNSFELKMEVELSKKECQQKIKIKGDLIITVARLMPWKYIDFLIKLMPDLKKINPNFKLIIVGSGREESYLKKIIKELQLDHNVILVGRVPRINMCCYYNASSLFVLNSSYEGLSHVILEAMYHGLPIIVSNVGGNPELIQDDYNGLLVEFNNKEQWLKAINRLWKNKELQQRLSSNPLVKMDVFSFEKMIKDTIKVLEA